MRADPEQDPDQDLPQARGKDPRIGRVIAGKFRLERLIGEGAMGCVYKGEHTALGRPVAIKLLHTHLGGDPRIARRFHREARAASRLSHPNSLQVIDFGEDDGDLFIAMELLDGYSLQAVIDAEAPFSPVRINDLLGQTLRALDEAHHAGIIHRDLKPENVIVLKERGGEERVKVCDFGIAKIMESEGRTTAITKDGYVCGTPEYMAPEQARGDVIDARADVYAAGVVLYQMLCGKVPFRAETALGIITKHLTEAPVPPRRRRKEWGIPRALQDIAMRAISKDPDDRYESAAALASALNEAVLRLGDRAHEALGSPSHIAAAAEEPELEDAVGETSPENEAPPAQIPSNRWLYGLGLALAVLAFGVWLWAQPHEATRTEQDGRVTEPEHGTPPTTDPLSVDVTNGVPDGPAIEPPLVEPVQPPDEPSDPDVTVGDPTNSRTTPRAARRPNRTPRATAEPDLSPGERALREGRRRLVSGDLSGAIEQLRAAATAMPRNAQVQKQLGRAYMRQGQVEQGAAAYQRYLTLAPNAPDRAIIERLILSSQ